MMPTPARPLQPVTPPLHAGVARPASNALPRPPGAPDQATHRLAATPHRQPATEIVAAGSSDDAYANHHELREGLESRGLRVEATDDMLDVVIATYGEGNGALNAQQLEQALGDGALRIEGGAAWVDARAPQLTDSLATAAVVRGSRDDNHGNHSELRSGLEDLGYDVDMSNDVLDVVIAEYGSGNGALSPEELGNAIGDGVIRLGSDNRATVDPSSPALADRVAEAVVARGSDNDAYANHTEIREGLESLGFDVRADNDQLDALIARHGQPGVGALNASQLASALRTGELRIDGMQASFDAAAGLRAAELGSHPVTTFADEVAGTEPRPVDRDLASLAAAAYDPSTQNVGNWSRLNDQQLLDAGIDPDALASERSSLKAGIYTDGNGRYVLSFAGTEGFNPFNHDSRADWWNNLVQGVGSDSVQYSQALALATDAKAAFGDDLVLTGHSLGGGLASSAAMAVDAPAVTFNPAGVHDNTLTRNSPDAGPDAAAQARAQAADGQVRRYVVEGEVLDYLQDHGLTGYVMPSALGHEVTLPDPNPLNPLQNLLPPWRAAHSVGLHLMPAVQTAMDRMPLFNQRVDNTRPPQLEAPTLAPVHLTQDIIDAFDQEQ